MPLDSWRFAAGHGQQPPIGIQTDDRARGPHELGYPPAQNAGATPYRGHASQVGWQPPQSLELATSEKARARRIPHIPRPQKELPGLDRWYALVRLPVQM